MKNKYQLKPIRQQITTCLIMLPLSFSLLAQIPPTLEVQGQINDGTLPIPGATVLIKGEQRGAVSDLNGHYQINAKANDTLVISYIGFATVEEPINNRSTINIVMREDATTLREVVINAGYYSVKDKERTGSISRITSKEIENQPVNNPLEALQGRLAGVDIIQNSGIPGGGFEVRIRGQNSIMAGNAPLYIIDGVPFDSGTLGSPNTSSPIIPGGSINPLNMLNPSSIESVEILKDADATAIYGSRGSNGVVLITTKKGKEGKTQFTVESSSGFATITRKRDLMQTEQYLEMRREAFANDGITEYPPNAYDINGTWDQDQYTDWQDVLTGGTADFHSMQASVSGGSEQTQFFLNGRYQKESTVFPGNFNYDRIAFNSNLNHTDKSERFRLSLTTAYTLEDNLLPGKDLTFEALRLAPNAPSLYDENGNLNWENSTWSNPLAQLNGAYKMNSKSLISNMVLSYKLWNSLEAKVSAGYGFSHLEDSQASPHTIYDPAFGMDSSLSTLFTNDGSRNSWIVEPQMHWEKQFQNSKLSLLAGSTFQKQNFEQVDLLTMGFADNRFIYNLSAASFLMVLNHNQTEYNYHSVFSRVNYAYDNSLYINLTGRRDGSSRFGPGKRYGNFGAVGAAWIFSDALEMPWLNFGKIRSSLGVTGNDQIGDYQYLQTYIITDDGYEGNIGLTPARLFNDNLQWEKNNKKEIALELQLFNRRVNLNSSYYNNRSSNQLINYTLPATTGFTSIQANLDALVENSGWEFELNATILRNSDFKWNLNANLTLPKNKLLRFPGLEDSPYANRYIIGQPLSIARLYKLTGVNPDTGLFEFEDFNGDGLITAAEDREHIADLSPELFGGVANTFNYKNWSLEVFFQFMKRKGYNQYRFSEPPGTLSNQPLSVLDRWQGQGDIATMQRFTTANDPEAYQAYSFFSQSNAAVSDASFVRLKSLALTYQLPLPQTTKYDCKLFVRGQNLLTFTRFKGGDPEQMMGFIPPLKRMELGVQIQL